MNKAAIKSAISIEFALSIKEAGRIVDIVFEVLEDFVKRNKEFEIRKFGKFSSVTVKNSDNKKHRALTFTPSKKLSKRANYNFENLKKVKIQVKDKNEIEQPDDFDHNLPDDFVKQIIEKSEDAIDIVFEEEVEQVKGARILIPDNLIKLHKEITEDDKKEPDKKNLWG